MNKWSETSDTELKHPLASKVEMLQKLKAMLEQKVEEDVLKLQGLQEYKKKRESNG